ncbi:AAA family ATPase [Sphaerospermopsis sp. FACHB-1094]|uniref:AAA family ATPase n=1 Tax=Sphaerospermopsis sp. FACHB-1094 TaxID=2692861 RepID=UPI001F552864|nr:AAA family ATPase [Sphaerospermopsis sp. FACHB-1094]
MTWQEFLNQQANIQGLSVEEKTTLLTALPHPDAQINQTQLRLKLNIAESTVKLRLQKIYEKFETVYAKLREKDGAGKFEKLRTCLKQQYHQPQSEATVKNPISDKSISPEFQSLITEKTQSFCGRGFVFAAFQNFTNTNKKGYFTVIGDAGMGKSTIAAKYVSENNAICYFNVLVDGRNRPELFLESIRKQLINRYQITNVENADLSTLLVKVTEKLSENEKLIIVVDALDEVNQEPGPENILYLPKTLPDNVYFLLTRRRYEPSKKRLYTEGVKQEELDLTDKKYDAENAKDIQEYIRFCLENDPEHKNGLQNWISNRKITPDDFVQKLADKSENNFMYLRYVLPAIAEGDYDDVNLTQLPQGLQNYYQTHWDRMKMNDSSKEMKVMILFTLVEIATPIPCEMIFNILHQDEYVVQDVLDEWIEYLRTSNIDGDICYSIYHASFLDFLKAKRELQATRKLFKEVNQRIADYLEQDEDDNETN